MATSDSQDLPEKGNGTLFFLLLVAILYVVIVSWNLDDADLLRSTEVWQMGVNVPVASGILDLPAAGIGVSIVDYFTIAPIVILSLHVWLLAALRADLLAEKIENPPSNMLILAVILAAPIALLIIQRAYIPFAAIRPETNYPLGPWLLSVSHAALIAGAGVAVPIFLFAPGTTRRSGPRPLSLAAVRFLWALIAVGAVMACLDLSRMLQSAALASQDPQSAFAVPVSSLLPLPVAALALFFQSPLILVAMFGRSLFWRASRSNKTLPMQFLSTWSVPMIFRMSCVVLALVTMVQMTTARPLVLSGRTIADAVPSETLIAAYVSASYPKLEKQALYRAYGDHAEGIDLQKWRLSRAKFDGAFLPLANFSDAVLRGANFNGAVVGILVAEASLEGATFKGADLTGATFSRDEAFGGWEEPKSLPQELNTGGGLASRNLFEDFCRSRIETNVARRLAEVDLTGAIMDYAVLHAIDFSVIRGKSLTGASFRYADLRCASFACLAIPPSEVGAMFEGADLRGADFRGTDLAAADFNNAQLMGAQLTSECPASNEGESSVSPQGAAAQRQEGPASSPAEVGSGEIPRE